ncbi:MAG: Rpn family recombination-promoting nuclease/putative transposase [Candidatus Azobacteroides sp.]|nr:Rpn family recombination-promoting nuclease/putative transposase [Candidatus Azobacteroides sp.]
MEVFIKEIYLNPLTDFGFKKLFFNELNKELLIDLLNEIIQEQGKITGIRYLPTEQLGNDRENRKAIFDIYCTNEKGEFFIVELQKAREPYFRDRSLYYSSFPIQNQGKKGIWDFKLKAVYLVAILDFIIFDEPEEENHVIEHVRLLRERTKTVYSDKLNFVFVELPKFKKEAHELKTNVDRWLFLLKNLSKLNSRPIEVQGKIFEKLFKLAEIKQLTPKEMETYNKSILEYQDIRRIANYTRKEGREEGREEGLKEGLKKGLEKGLKRKSIETARNCLKEGLSIELIAKITGLSPEQVKALNN